MAKDAPLLLVTPDASLDRPAWGRVGAIAIVGFVLGVAWPRLAGVRLAPKRPGGDVAATATPATTAVEATAAATAPAEAPPPSPAPNAAPAEPQTPPAVEPTEAPVASAFVLRASVLSCKTSDGDAKRGKECGGASALEAAVGPRLRKLPSSCPAAAEATGKVSFVVTADFASKAPTVELGKSSTLTAGDAVLACARSAVAQVALGGLAHDHPRYVVSFMGERKDEKKDERPAGEAPRAEAPASASASSGARAPAASPERGAEIVWDAALVRDVPRTGAIVGRLPRGTRVDVRGSKDGWFEVTSGDVHGFVHRSALGR